MYSSYEDYAPKAGPFAPYLRRAETVLWRGKPDAAAYDARTTIFLGLMLLPLVVALYGAHSGHRAAEQAAWVVLDVIVLLAISAAVRASRARRTEYAVTEERILIHVATRLPHIFSYDLRDTPIRELRPVESATWHLTGSGMIWFAGQRPLAPFDLLMLPDPLVHARTPSFVALRSPSDAYRVIEDARELPSLRRGLDAEFFDAPEAPVE